MAVAGSLTYETELDKKGFEKGLKTLQGTSEKAFKAISLGVAALVGTAITGLSSITKLALENYASYEQLVGGVDTLFKNSSQKVQEYANKAYKTAGMSANDYMETVTGFTASLLQSLSGDTEKAADVADMALTDMADNANKMRNIYGSYTSSLSRLCKTKLYYAR